MIVQPEEWTAFGARPLLAISACQANMHFARRELQLNRLNSPRALGAQYRCVQFVILHDKNSGRQALYTVANPLQSRNSQQKYLVACS